MLIPLFNFLFIIQITKSQQEQSVQNDSIWEIDLNEYNNQWEQNIFNTNQIFFVVKNLQTTYCYVRIQLQQNDPSLLLMADYGQFPKDSQIQQYKQGEKIDRISFIENRKTRFLKLKPKLGDIYLQIKTNNTDNQFYLYISGSDNEECDNECSNNGVCQSNGCSCYQSYIGNDCNQIAEEILVGTQKEFNLTTSQQFSFFYIDLKPLMNHTLKFDLTLVNYDDMEQIDDCNNCVAIWIYKSKALVKQFDDEMNQYYHKFFLEEGTQTITTKIPLNLNIQSQILWFAIKQDYDKYITIQLSMIVNYNDPFIDTQDSNEDDQTNKLLYIIIPSVAGPLFILFLTIWIMKRKKVKEVEQCAICIEDLNPELKAITKIQCNHQFHQDCIQNWANQIIEKSCPICRRVFNLNQNA